MGFFRKPSAKKKQAKSKGGGQDSQKFYYADASLFANDTRAQSRFPNQKDAGAILRQISLTLD